MKQKKIVMMKVRQLVPAALTGLLGALMVLFTMQWDKAGLDAAGTPNENSFGTIEGTLDVSPIGEVGYTIPIKAAPGIGGLQPNLALTYASNNNSNGPLGIGWTLSGLSEIRRCGRLPYLVERKDSQGNEISPGKGGVNYDERDRLCLDGKQLVRTNLLGPDESYWGHERTYRTEIESYVSVTAVGDCSRGSCYFTLKDKEGRTFSYGNKKETKVPGPGGPGGQELAWKLRSVEDSHGNGMYINYIPVEGHAYPARIQYNNRYVHFVYTDKTSTSDMDLSYDAYGQRRETKRLSEIQLKKKGETLFKRYYLSYAKSAYTNRSRLMAVQECDGANNCLEKTEIVWETNHHGNKISFDVFEEANLKNTQTEASHINILTGDFNGDGKTDFIRQERGPLDDDTFGTFSLFYARKRGEFERVNFNDRFYNELMRYDPGFKLVTGDFNGDGRTDLIRIPRGNIAKLDMHENVTVLLADSKVEGKFKIVHSSLVPGTSAQDQEKLRQIREDHSIPHTGDFNGDGKTDILLQVKDKKNGPHLVLLSRGNGAFEVLVPGEGDFQNSLYYNPGALLIMGDFNGDGLTDFVRQSRKGLDNNTHDNFALYLARGNGTFQKKNSNFSTLLKSKNGPLFAGDYNGDGKTDLLQKMKTDEGGNHRILFSHGNGIFTARGQEAGLLEGMSYIPGDFDGDGKADFLHQSNVSKTQSTLPRFGLYSFKGNGSFIQHSSTIGTAYNKDLQLGEGILTRGVLLFPGDFDGDGRMDFIRQSRASRTGLKLAIYMNNAIVKAPDNLIAKIKRGRRHVEQLEYKPLSRSSTYEDGAYEDIPSLRGVKNTVQGIPGTLWVVKQRKHYDGTDAQAPTLTQNYRYQTGILDLLGRGFLGFEKVNVETVETDLRVVYRYLTTVPFHGKLHQESFYEIKPVAGKLHKIKEQQWVKIDATQHTTYQILPAVETTRTYLEGQQRNTRTVLQYNQYGLPVIQASYDYANRGAYRCNTYHSEPFRANFGLLTSVKIPDWKQGDSIVGGISPETCNSTAFLKETDYVYNGDRSLQSETSRDGSVSLTKSYEYDAYGNRTRLTHPTGLVETTVYENDYHTYPVSVRYGHLETKYEYDGAYGNLLKKTEPAGGSLRFEYDTFGRVTGKYAEDGNGKSEWLEFRQYAKGTEPANAHVRIILNPGPDSEDIKKEHIETVYFDYLDNPIRSERTGSDGKTIRELTEWDVRKRKVRESEPHYIQQTGVKWTLYQYDLLDRPTRITPSVGADTEIVHAFGGAHCDANEVYIRYSLAGKRNRVHCRNADGKDTRKVFLGFADGETPVISQIMSYDALGRLLKLNALGTNGSRVGSQTDYEYDGLGRLKARQHSQRGRVEFTYNAGGQLERRTVPGMSGNIEFKYDSNQRLEEKRFPDGKKHIFEYDGPNNFARGRIYKMVTLSSYGQETSSKVFDYDFRGRVSGETIRIDGESFTLAYTYNRDNRLKLVTYPDGAQLRYNYDAAANLRFIGLADAVGTNSRHYAIYADYTALGQAGKVLHRNGNITSYTYNETNRRLERLRVQGRDLEGRGQILMDRIYQWNEFDEITSVQNTLFNDRSFQYTYNIRGLLNKATVNGQDLFYKYNAAGNLISKEGVRITYKEDRPVSDSRGFTYEYDARGNRTAKRNGTDVTNYFYDAQDKLLQVASEEKSLGRYTYDASGKRIKKIDAQGNVSLYVSPFYEISNRSGEKQQTKYLPGLGGRAASITTEYAGTANAFLHTQHSMRAAMYDVGTVQGMLGYGNEMIMMFVSHPQGLGTTAVRLTLLTVFTILILALSLWYGFRAARREGLIGKLRDRTANIAWRMGILTAEQAQGLSATCATEFVSQNRAMAGPIPLLAFSFLAFFVLNCGAENPRNVHALVGQTLGLPELADGIFGEQQSFQTSSSAPADAMPVLGTQIFHQDHLGSTSMVTDERGQVVSRTYYKPYGETYEPVGLSTSPDNYRAKFSGKELDSGAGLYYFNARHYDPELGTFLQADTMAIGSNGSLSTDLNRYAYAGNSPLVYTDPSGRFIGLILSVILRVVLQIALNVVRTVIRGVVRGLVRGARLAANAVRAQARMSSKGKDITRDVVEGLVEGFLTEFVDPLLNEEEEFNLGEALLGALTGGISGRRNRSVSGERPGFAGRLSLIGRNPSAGGRTAGGTRSSIQRSGASGRQGRFAASRGFAGIGGAIRNALKGRGVAQNQVLGGSNAGTVGSSEFSVSTGGRFARNLINNR